MQTEISDFAPAKINLSLHVTGQRSDGYHLLDSLVAFASIGDRLTAEPSSCDSLSASGPFAAGLPVDETNLVLRAARLCKDRGGIDFHLEKNLPPASGIGGGSSDAAAALRLAKALYPNAGLADREAITKLGADIPVCLRPAGLLRMEGVGEVLTAQPPLPLVHLLLVNPRVEVPTPVVFKALPQKNNPAMPATIPSFDTTGALAAWLSAHSRNDLEAPAIAHAGVIAEVLTVLRGMNGVLLARMSGSGATCFGLFKDATAALHAGQVIKRQHPEWWQAAGHLI